MPHIQSHSQQEGLTNINQKQQIQQQKSQQTDRLVIDRPSFSGVTAEELQQETHRLKAAVESYRSG
eukprot:scaffold453289_cov14-Prasinocladus_malaysianus.AAC.1